MAQRKQNNPRQKALQAASSPYRIKTVPPFPCYACGNATEHVLTYHFGFFPFCPACQGELQILLNALQNPQKFKKTMMFRPHNRLKAIQNRSTTIVFRPGVPCYL